MQEIFVLRRSSKFNIQLHFKRDRTRQNFMIPEHALWPCSGSANFTAFSEKHCIESWAFCHHSKTILATLSVLFVGIYERLWKWMVRFSPVKSCCKNEIVQMFTTEKQVHKTRWLQLPIKFYVFWKLKTSFLGRQNTTFSWKPSLTFSVQMFLKTLAAKPSCTIEFGAQVTVFNL